MGIERRTNERDVAEGLMPLDSLTPGAARHAVAALLVGTPPSMRDAAVAMISELVTNAIRHGGGVREFSVRVSERRLRVEVSDLVSTPPTVLKQSWEAPGGRGMLIVEALASWWGVEQLDRGKIVAFELDLGACGSDLGW
jgi:anti-sigma regulatory factor (Ser/Thr protein kinase)